MPRLNLRKKSTKSIKTSDGMKVKVPSNVVTPLALRMKGKDEDISSDEEEEAVHRKRKGDVGEDDEEDERYALETPDERRKRLAKEYLKNLAQIETDDDESDQDGDQEVHLSISEKLRQERLRSQGRLSVNLAPQFSSLSLTDDLVTVHYSGHHNSITSMSVTQDETSIVTGSKDNSVVQWDTETGQRTFLKRRWNRRLDGDQQSHHGEILAVAVSHDGKYVASGGRDRLIRIHDGRVANSEIKTFSAHRDAISGLCFQSNSYALFSASFDRCVKYFDLNNMAYVETVFGHQDAVLSVDCWHKLRPLSSSADRTNRLWKIEDNAHLVFRGHKSPIDCARILSDSTFVSAGQDGRLSLWDHGKKTPVASVAAAHGQESESSVAARWITSLAAVRACDTVATGSYDGYVRIWSVPPAGERGAIDAVQAIPVAGFVNALHLSSRLLIAGGGREHRLGRWWCLPSTRDQLTVIRFKEDLAERAMASHQVTGKTNSTSDESMSEDEAEEE